MANPFDMLGINPNASENEIKEAYKKRVREHSGDEAYLYELDKAYDEIIMMKNNSGQSNNTYYSPNYDDFGDIRAKLNAGRIDDAEMLLDGIPSSRRNAQWYYLKGCVMQTRGWLESAAEYFKAAYEAEPSNSEYKEAYNRTNRSQRGEYGTHTNIQRERGGCFNSPCDLCSSLLCADCCCECMGGDLIRCC